MSPPPAPAPNAIDWPDPRRHAAFERWLATQAERHGLLPRTLRPASADASFRRYFRVDTGDGCGRIIMDAPPERENCAPFVQVAGLMRDAGLNVPTILAWDEAGGFMLMSDLGARTMMEAIDPARPEANRPLYVQALDALLKWQLASRPGVLPPYDAALLRRELQLFPDWYVAQHRGIAVEGALRATLEQMFGMIVARNLAAPQVFVHRDFMPRNLMVPPRSPAAHGALPPEGALAALGRPGDGEMLPPPDENSLGVLDFQDAVHGSVTYDIASLMRDAFLSWDEEFVLDITIRYWECARRLGLMDFEDWHQDFGSFWRAVEWMGLQRHLKVAGIFARLTLRDGKPKYLQDAPRPTSGMWPRATASWRRS